MGWLYFLIVSLAVFRLTVLITDDDGPFHMFRHFRAFLSRKARTEPIVRKSKVHEGIRCPRCGSVWIAIPVAAYVMWHHAWPEWLANLGDWFLLMMALSAMAILFHRAFPER